MVETEIQPSLRGSWVFTQKLSPFFISSRSVDHFYDEFDEEEGRNPFTILAGTMFCVFIIATLALLLPGMDSLSSRFSSLRNPARPPVLYNCPSTVNGDGHESGWDEDFLHQGIASNK
jgi:hypothetical protein